MEDLESGNEELIFVQEDGLGLRVASSHTGRNSRNEEKRPVDDPQELFPVEQKKNESVEQGDSGVAEIEANLINNGWTIFPKGDEVSLADHPSTSPTPTLQGAKESQSSLLPANQTTDANNSGETSPLIETARNNDRTQTGKLPAKSDVFQRTSKPRLNVKSGISSERKSHEIQIKMSNSGKEDIPLILKSNPEKPGSKNSLSRAPVHRKKFDLSSPLSARGASTSQQQKDCRLLTFRSSTVSRRNDPHMSNQNSSRSEPRSLHSAATSPLESNKTKASDPLVSHLEFIISKMDSLHPKLRVSPLSTLARPWHIDKTKSHVLSQEHVSALSIAVGGATLPRPPWNDSTLPDPIIRRVAGGDRRVRTSKDSNVAEGISKHPIQNGDTVSASGEALAAVGVSESGLNADCDQGRKCLTDDVGVSDAPAISAKAPGSIPPTDTHGMPFENIAQNEIQMDCEEGKYDNDEADFENEEDLDGTATAASHMVQPPHEIDVSSSHAGKSELATQDAGPTDLLRPASAILPGKSKRTDEPIFSVEQLSTDHAIAAKVEASHDTLETEVANCLPGADHPVKGGNDRMELGVEIEEVGRVDHGQECNSKSRRSQSPTYGPILSVADSQGGSRPASVMTVGSAEESNDDAKSRQSVCQDDASPVVISRPASRQTQKKMSEVGHNEDTAEDFAGFVVKGGSADCVDQEEGLVEVIDGVDFDWTVQPNQSCVDDHTECLGHSPVANKNAELNGSMEIGDDAGEYHSDFDAIDEPVLANDAKGVEQNTIMAQSKQNHDVFDGQVSDLEVEKSTTGDDNKVLEQEESQQDTAKKELKMLEGGIEFSEEDVGSTLSPEQEKGQIVLHNIDSDEIAKPAQRQQNQSPCTEIIEMENQKSLSCVSISKSVDDVLQDDLKPQIDDSCLQVTLQAVDLCADKLQEGLNGDGSPNATGSNEAFTEGYDPDFEDVDHPTEASDMGNADSTGLLPDTLVSSCKVQSASATGDALLDQVESGLQSLMDGRLTVQKNSDSENNIAVEDKKVPLPANNSDNEHVEDQQSIPIQLNVNADLLLHSSSSPALKDDISDETEWQENKTSALADAVPPSQAETHDFCCDMEIQNEVLNFDETAETGHDKMEFPFDDEKSQYENGTVETAVDNGDVHDENGAVAYEDSWECEDAKPLNDNGQITTITELELGPEPAQ